MMHAAMGALYTDYSEWEKEQKSILCRFRERAKKELQMMDATLMIEISSFEEIINRLTNVENYDLKVYQTIDNALEKILGFNDDFKQLTDSAGSVGLHYVAKYVAKARGLSNKVKCFIKEKEKV